MSYHEHPKMLPAPQSRSLTLQAADQANLPAVIEDAGDDARAAFLEFFIATIRNPNTRTAYAHAVRGFFEWCQVRGVQLLDVEPLVVAAYIEEHPGAPPTVKQHLSAIRMLFDYFVQRQVLPSNPASVVRGPKYVVKKGKTPVLSRADMRTLLDSIPTDTIIGLRDRALIGTMLFSLARVGAVTKMKRGDYQTRGKNDWLRLHEKGGKFHEVPAHHLVQEWMDAYLEVAAITEKASPLFQSVDRSGALTGRAINRKNVLDMIARRCLKAGLSSHYTPHSLRATGITVFMENGGKLEDAQAIAAHESPRTTKLYDRSSDVLQLSEIEKISL